MSFLKPAKLGETIILSAQLWDQDESMPKRVFCDLKRPDGTFLEPRFELTYQSLGRFVETRTMPAEDEFSALYYVFEVDGVTEDFTYGVGEDVFVRDITGEIVEDGITAQSGATGPNIEGTLSDEGHIEANITDENITGLLNDNETIEGVVTDEC